MPIHPRELMTDQSLDTTQVQLGEPVSFIEVTYRNMGEELLIGSEMTQRQLHHPAWVTLHKRWDL